MRLIKGRRPSALRHPRRPAQVPKLATRIHCGRFRVSQGLQVSLFRTILPGPVKKAG